jgi:hypothetical protein
MRCTMQPVINSTLGNKSQSPTEVSPKEQPSTSQIQSNESGSQSLLATLCKQWLEAEISNRQDNRDGRWEWTTTTSSSYPSAQQRNKGNPRTLDGKCAVLIYVSVNYMFHEILKKFVVIWVLTHSRVNHVQTLLYWAKVCSINKCEGIKPERAGNTQTPGI